MARLTKAERAAVQVRDETLASILAAASDWDRAVVRRAILAVAREHGTVSANSVRELLPEGAQQHLAAALRGLTYPGGPLEHTGRYVPSTSPRTKGHRIAVYRMRRLVEAGEAA